MIDSKSASDCCLEQAEKEGTAILKTKLTDYIGMNNNYKTNKHNEFQVNVQLEKLDPIFYQNLVLNSPMAIYTSTPQGRFLTANPAMARMFGYETPEELLESITDIAAQIYAKPADREELTSRLELHGEVEDFECMMLRRDGSRFWCSLNALLVRSHAREEVYYQVFVKDITKRKLAEQALNESEKWRNVLQNTPQIGLSLDTQGKIIFANKYFLGLTGWNEEQVLGQSWFDMFIPADIRKQIKKVFNSLMSSKHNNRYSKHENAILTRNGDLRIITWSNILNLDKEGYATDITSLGVDTTERNRLENALKTSEEKYRSLMEQSMDMIFLHDLEGNFLEVNRAAITCTGYSRDELLAMNVFDLHPDGIKRKNELIDMWARWRPGESIILEFSHLDTHGRKYPVEINSGKVCFGNRDYILATIRDISQRKKAEEDLKESRQRFEYLLQSSARKKSLHNIIGHSKQIQQVFALLQQVAGVDTTILITGETGTGKELVADALHASSPRSKGPLIKVNCLTLSDELLDSELFGHVKGAFTGAYANKIGRVEAAEGGTLFLDEIGDITPRIQLKLLRFLQEKEYERVGQSITRKADVRIIAATNADLAKKVAEGSFRKDLYYRLNVLNIHVPPLRERTEDIPLLMDHFRRAFSEKFGKNIKGFSSAAIRTLADYSWPGNVRELEHFIERAVLVSPNEIIEPEHFGMEDTAEKHQSSLVNKSGDVERNDLSQALKAAGGKKTDAARIMGISRRTLYRKLHKYGLLE